MENLHILMAGVTAIILFVFGLEHFSKEIEKISGEKFRKSLSRATRLPIVGLVLGAVVTAIIQSSSATSVITISLVNAGVLSFKNSIGIIFGSNIGTTITAQLVAFKLTAFAPVFIILGFVLSLMRARLSIFGKTIFYFGFVFFSLNLISSSLQPLQNNESLINLLTQPQNPVYAVLFGCLFTAIVQSSSVTTGLAIVFVQQGLLSLENAVPLIMGANIGTTATALVAVFGMDIAAKKTALCHFLFNVGGVLLFLPALMLFGNNLSQINMEPAVALANIHLVFNVATSAIFIVFIGPFSKLVDTILGHGKMDFQRLVFPAIKENKDFKALEGELEDNLYDLLYFLQENYNSVTLSIETNYKSIHSAAEKRIEYVDYLKSEYLVFFSRVVTAIEDEEESKRLINIINEFDYLFQIHDSIKDLFKTKKVILEHYIDLHSDILMMIRELSGRTLNLFDDIYKSLHNKEDVDINVAAKELQANINEANKEILALIADPERRDAGALINFITYSQRLKDKLINFSSTVREQ